MPYRVFSRGRDGLVALHQRYFARAECPSHDEILRDYDDEFARAKQKASLKYRAEKEHKGRNGNGQLGPFQQGRGCRGRGGGNGGRGCQRNWAAAAAAGGAAPGAEVQCRWWLESEESWGGCLSSGGLRGQCVLHAERQRVVVSCCEPQAREHRSEGVQGPL